MLGSSLLVKMLSSEKPTSLRMAKRANKRRDLAVFLGLFVVALALAVVFLYNLWATHVFCSEIEQLSSEVQSLQHKTDSLKSAYLVLKNSTQRRPIIVEDTIENLQPVEKENVTELTTSSASTVEGISKTDETFNVIQQNIEKLKEEQRIFGAKVLSKVDLNDTRAMLESINELSKKLQQTQSTVDSLKSSIDNTYKGLNSLGGQLNEHIGQPHHLTVNLETLCSTHREQCSVPSSRQGGYWKSCRTRSTTLNQAVSINFYS